MASQYYVHHLGQDDSELMNALLSVFGAAFNEVETYVGKRPGPEYIRRLLGSDYFIALAALEDNEVVGGIAAYHLKKFEQERKEIYISDLAVAEEHRRKGIATGLIRKLRKIAAARGAYVIFVQADTGVEDEPAIALYTKLGVREDVLHFDIAVEDGDDAAAHANE
uniref:AAC(3)-I family aminoglycoside 3-N-acetyltransferase n=1 Tax=uncultured bacterium TaxID=77133 RepID=UPI0001F35D01|nr:AAC(3)-I family aminoglycoside 3-N-acetyltransferase [uncultured bacterium]CBI71176.1 gentamycin 3-N-acetyltransferase [uncultured bacterium]